MNVAVLRSIKPYWVYLICEGKKTIEIGKNRPRSDRWNKLTNIYCSKDLKSFNRIPEEYREKYRPFLGKVVAEFICNNFTYIEAGIDLFGNKHLYNTAFIEHKTCLSDNELFDYLYDEKHNRGYAWHISNLTVYNKPKELYEFVKPWAREHNYFLCPVRDNEKKDCKNNIKRPPQTWCYVRN